MSLLDAAARLVPPRLMRIGLQTVGDLRDIELFDRAMTLAAQAFTSVFPVIIAFSTLRPRDESSVGGSIANVLSLPPSSRDVVEQALPTTSESSSAFGLLGVMIVMISATSFSRALARMYGKVWVSKPAGLSGGWRWVAVLLGIVMSMLVLSALRRASSGIPYDTALDWLFTLAVGTLVWTWVPWLLLAGQVDWRRLLPGGILMGLGSIGTSIGSAIYMPRALSSASRQFGALGIAFTYISWLFVVALVLITATVLGAVLTRDHERSRSPAEGEVDTAD